MSGRPPERKARGMGDAPSGATRHITQAPTAMNP